MDDHQLKSAVEALVFVSGNPLSMEKLKGIFEETPAEQIQEQVRLLQQEYIERGSGLMLTEVAGGYQLATRPEHFGWVRKFKSVKTSSRLSKPALETLAIVAYKQPITRSEVEAIRGVNIGGIMRNLMERHLAKIVGKKDVPGKPMLYGTTPEFLQYFGLKDLSALPTLKEFQELEAGEEVMEEVSLVEKENSDISSIEDTVSEEALSPVAVESETRTAASAEENVSG